MTGQRFFFGLRTSDFEGATQQEPRITVSMLVSMGPGLKPGSVCNGAKGRTRVIFKALLHFHYPGTLA